MSYNKTNWVQGQTALNASNMNHIEDGIFQNSNDISTHESKLNNLPAKIAVGTASVNLNGTATVFGTIDYSSARFTSIPKILISQIGGISNVKAVLVSAEGLNSNYVISKNYAYFQAKSTSSNDTGTLAVNWIAIGS